MRGRTRSGCSPLQVLETAHCDQVKHGGRTRTAIGLGQPRHLYQESLIGQGYTMGPVHTSGYQSCMALVDLEKSGAERTRHIQIRYFWVKEQVDTGEV